MSTNKCRLLCYDRSTHMLLLSRGSCSVLVDVTVCLDGVRDFGFLLVEQCQIMVMGHLESVEVSDTATLIAVNANYR